MDNQECHHTDEIIEYCYTNNIVLFPLPPNSTHYLQPLDVGVFGPFKHWHQEVLYRAIADGAYNFNKTDFFFHLQEIRDRTFKKSTIRSAWARSGLFPFDPSVVLDALQDPLSSLTPNVNVTSLPGHIDVGDKENDEEDEEDHFFSSDESSGSSSGSIAASVHRSRRPTRPTTPQPSGVIVAAITPQKTPYSEWKEVATPSLNIPMIERYYKYVQLRMEVSINSGLALTPSVLRTLTKARKVGRALELNGITAANELRRHKEKTLSRQKLQDERRIVAKFGPITVGDARSRVATDDHNRRAAQADEVQRIERKAIRNEEAFLRRWLRIVRGFVRAGITEIQVQQLKVLGPDNTGFSFEILVPQQWFLKQDKRLFLNSLESMTRIYALHRELREEFRNPQLQESLMWPLVYYQPHVVAAIELVITKEDNRKMKKIMLSQEMDGMSVFSIEESVYEASVLDEICVETQYEEF
jgi:hypothetical protein